MKKLLWLALSSALLSSFSVQAKDSADIIGAPATIPHPIASYLPITPEQNMCVMCHKEQSGKTPQKMEIPSTHFINHQLDPARYECTLCHAATTSQAEVKPVDPNASI